MVSPDGFISSNILKPYIMKLFQHVFELALGELCRVQCSNTNASDDIVDMCVATEVHHLLEKPVRPYALQLAVRSIMTKYLKFAKRVLMDPEFAESVGNI